MPNESGEQIRTMQFRMDNPEKRTIVGIAVPYGEAADIGGYYYEKFVAGAFQESTENVKLFYEHEVPIGKVIAGRDTDAGYEITAQISDTIRGNEVLTLLKDGVLNRFSVRFEPIESIWEEETIVRTKALLKEVSVVAFPAFKDAEIQEIRKQKEKVMDTTAPDTTAPDTTAPDTTATELRKEFAEFRREMLVSSNPIAPATQSDEFRSIGAYAKALLAGDPKAKDLARAASTSADAYKRPAFIGYIETLIQNSRPTLNAFSTKDLPDSGLSVEYAAISDKTIAVGKQATENTALAFGNLKFAPSTAPVDTYGGYTTFSKQYIERSSIATLDVVFEALANAYGSATNAAVVAALAAKSYTGKDFTGNAGTAQSLLTAIANGAVYINQATGLNPDFIVAGSSAYVAMISVAGADGRPVISTNADGSNTIGSANVPGLSANLFGLPVILDPQLAADTAYLANRAGLQTLESPGAPIRLTDGDITTLTDATSVYGYLAITIPRFGAIVKLTVVPA